jgi:anti-sigma regulatory factor (Ser/Thr protein kinase)
MEREFEVEGGDFANAGSASAKVKEIVKSIGFSPEAVRRIAICSYEAEVNIVLYAKRGKMKLSVYEDYAVLHVKDEGPGIEDIELAMQEGYSTATPEMRELGFGAGMGLPNIKKNSDIFTIISEPGKGTELRIMIRNEK